MYHASLQVLITYLLASSIDDIEDQIISMILSKQYSGLAAGALCRLDAEGIIKLQPIYAYMDGDKYKTGYGYLKMVSDNNGSNRRSLMSKLAEYGITVVSYLESFIDQSKI
ncbi:unnamed protein product [Didymodactylos carnosus]|uniref:Uncharacterized protein n=1 Tax=Didymodactylos carnosus TaxID=1234261 RepID=A0A815A5Q1_9BILA|nr:unnamed protein product [Didymodactylos carnosus]CAF1545571.1 unnamed protein product [Didymodactylos carnosus]CAF4023476.1 unnamed protein product [Didymodactylos carnosus]CAF4334467.1 unnamed protein product [Didymodactylos carnosus]